MKKIILSIFLLILFGCSSTPNPWNYTPDSENGENNKLNISLKIGIFRDSRSSENIDRKFLTIWPIIPFAVSEYNRPELKWEAFPGSPRETTPKYLKDYFPPNFNLSVDLAKLTQEELQNNTFFSKVNFSSEKKNDFFLVGDIKKFSYKHTFITYLGGWEFPVIFWMIGLPSGRVHNDIAVEFKLVNSKTYQIVFEKKYTQHQSKIYNCFFYNEKDLAPYDNLWKNITRDLVKDINQQKLEIEKSMKDTSTDLLVDSKDYESYK